MKTIQTATLVGALASQALLVSVATAAPSLRDDRQMTQLGSQLLQAAYRADEALQKHDEAAANKDLDEAMAVRTKMAQDAKADGDSMMVPLYADLDDTEYLARIDKTGNPVGTTSPPENSSKRASQPMTVMSNVGQFTYLAIDLDKTNSRLNAAKIAIRNRNEQAAEDSLSAIGSNLVEVSVSTDLPLLTAREDLQLARTALNAKNDREAAVDLHQASQALAAYAASGPHAADAKALSSEIDSAATNTSRPALSTQTVDSWWERVKGWFAHPSL